MPKTVEAVVDERGNVRLLEDIRLKGSRRALVTIFEEAPALRVSETALLSEAALAEDWNRPEEDAAWSHLQPGRSSSPLSLLRPVASQAAPGGCPCRRGSRRLGSLPDHKQPLR